MNDLAPFVETHKSRDGASDAAASYLAQALASQLDDHARASLVVSGGSTPQMCFQRLACADLPWSRVDVTLTDERLVPPSHQASNERMVRRELLQHKAHDAQFVPLEETGLARVTKPFAAALVGMGEDGHFASIFPGMPGIEQALDVDGSVELLDVQTDASPWPRRTMTLSCLLQARQILLLVFGEAKKRIYEAPDGLPVAALLNQDRISPRIIWAP